MTDATDIQTTFHDKRAATWTDSAGTTHRAVGSEVHPGTLLLWTACERHDIPASAASTDGSTVSCMACALASKKMEG